MVFLLKVIILWESHIVPRLRVNHTNTLRRLQKSTHSQDKLITKLLTLFCLFLLTQNVPLGQQQAAGDGDRSHKACEITNHYQYLQPQVYGERLQTNNPVSPELQQSARTRHGTRIQGSLKKEKKKDQANPTVNWLASWISVYGR